MFESSFSNVPARFCRKSRIDSCHIQLMAARGSFSSLPPLSSEAHHRTPSGHKGNPAVKRTTALLIGLSFCFLLFSVIGSGISSAATTVYVDTDGTGDYNCDGTNDHLEINRALTYIDSLGGGTVYLRGPNTYWIDSTLFIGAHTVLTGDPKAEIKLVPYAGWSSEVPMIANMGSDDDITITGFTIDGNSANQGVSLGKGYYNMIYFEDADNIKVTHMRLEWGCGDGLKTRDSKGITFSNNDVYKLGHDAFYALACRDITVSGNTVFTRTNGACRLSGGAQDAAIYDNIFYSAIAGDSTGPAIELDKSWKSGTNAFDDIEIYNNRIHTLNGAAIWMSASYPDDVIHARDVHIHHNIFTRVGQYKTDTGYSNAAIVLCSFDNTLIENNVFDDGGHAGIKWFTRPGRPVQDVMYTTTVRNNIIMNSDGVSSISGSGVGVWNTDPSHCTFILLNNDIYNNKNGQTYGGGFTMSNNLNVDPLCADQTNTDIISRDYHLRSKAGRYSNGKLVADSVSSPLIDAGCYGSSCSSEPSPNGGRVNIGRYGNTAQASRSGTTVSNSLDYPPIPNVVLDTDTSQNYTVSFNASSSTDDMGIISYSWDFDASNGISTDARSATANNTYLTAGTFIVTLTVTDTIGQASSNTLQISVGDNNASVISSETSNVTGNITSPEVSYDTIYDTLSPVHDNRLRASLADWVLSNSTYIDIGNRSSASRDVMLFNLSMYNTTDILSNATLSLYWYYPANTTRRNDTIVEIYRPFAWDPEYVSWNRQNSTATWNTSGGNWFDHNGTVQGSEPYASLTFAAKDTPDNRYYDLNVTELVQEYINGTYNNTGFFLKARNESGNYIAFYSSDWSNASQRPKLTITVDRPPIANAGSDISTIVGTNTTFNGSSSTDDNGNVSYSWDFDVSDGITSEAATVTATKIYPSAGNYTVTLNVTDSRGQTSSDTLEVIVRNPPMTYTATYDNRLRESSAGSVLSTSDYLDIGKSAYRCRDLIWFNLSSYNTTDMIYNATLSLYWYYPENATRKSDTIVEIYRPFAWDPEYVSWNYRLPDTLWNTKGGNWFDRNNVSQGRIPYASLTFEANNTPDNSYYNLNVTDLVQEYVSGKYNNTGFFLKARNENGDYIAFYGSEWSNTSQRPKLTVTS